MYCDFKSSRTYTIKDIEKQDREDTNKHTGELSTSGPDAMRFHTPPTDNGRNARGSQAMAPSIESHLAATILSKDSPMSTGLNEPFKFLNVSSKNVNVVKLKGSDDEILRIHGHVNFCRVEIYCWLTITVVKYMYCKKEGRIIELYCFTKV